MFRLTDGAARIFTVISLCFPLSVHGQLAITSKFQSGRERVHAARKGEEEEEERRRRRKKSPEKSHFAEPGIRTRDLLVMSRVFYPLGHGATPWTELLIHKNLCALKSYKVLHF